MSTLLNLVRQASTTVGTGTLTLGSPVSGFLDVVSAGGVDGQTYSYGIEANYVGGVAMAREQGFGVLGGTGTTLTRNVINSTNGNALLVLTGDQQVIITPLASDFGGSPGGSQYQIQYNDSGFAGDPDMMWRPALGMTLGGATGSGPITPGANEIALAVGNYAVIGRATFAPGDPTNEFLFSDYPATIISNAYFSGDLSTHSFLSAFTGYPGFKHTPVAAGTASIYGIDFEPTINSDSTGDFAIVYATNFFLDNYGSGDITDFAALFGTARHDGSGSIANHRAAYLLTYVAAAAGPVGQNIALEVLAQNLNNEVNTTMIALQAQSYAHGNGASWGNVIGGYFGAWLGNGGTNSTTNLFGIKGYSDVDSGATATNVYGLFMEPFGGGTVTNWYGVYVADHSGIASGNSLNLISKGASSFNVFEGEIDVKVMKYTGGNTTGGGTALLGTNSPAITNSAPYTWVTALAADGSTVYVPAWK